MSKSKKKMADIKKKELTDEDKVRLQLIDEAINRIKIMPVDQSTNQQEQQIEPEHTARSNRKCNINKYKEVDKTTAQVEPEEAIQQLAEEQPKCIYISHPNLINDENDVEIVLEEAIIQPHTCIPKKFKKKDLIRVQDILIKNVSVKVLDKLLYNFIEKLYRVNCDFIRLSEAPEIENTDNDF
ncbi:MAG: hypothetical protein EZS28_025081 [Streblomastix strix]|uniref:Uncharacterized protein n=1 Tax=Streblomastix strix TaxID=222440 RepID=A0A5J4VAA1_9EUKA|nr:MAG: hypothetical protein EZS28_025081 [Streblomastix strix]